ncbi:MULTISPECIES: dicarboxylate/amino acid:cation symporter [unclassified Sporosarcina]|uniref:dicarboxylate/amino acid:cation symporter n=1 Tax=unclassified Sporosarcina TaxID=2647733 RepID=UPI000C16F291|nr:MULTISPECIES: dicarboxylate/amino acid:cation symporter [unclassified Sporosarcina]PIC99066.1 dicarboxylate/amino acid:cation symporter [Sporosarcina sp. P29]PID05532.1 dicarboxylate/amino acid:cation symporter [Sporosarcina sp. P30]PID08726.1 dicarboxylate/amino acid:cation symporter [Sporosarcina sp. P31]PID11898.1 dicarboxylate/amino acid:cation symporter [Sporosarcina sp. P32b]
MKLARNIIIALIAGVVVGLVLNIFTPGIFTQADAFLFKPLGTIFLNLMKMLVVPVVFISIVLGTVGIGDPKKLGRIGGKTIGFFLITTAIALVIAISLGLLLKPGEGGNFETANATYEAQEAPPVADTLLGIIPTNPISAMAEGNMLQIIFFAALIGFGMAMMGSKVERVKEFFEQANELIMYLITFVMKFAPYGAFGLIASAVGSQGMDALKVMGMYMGVVLGALLIHTIVVYGGSVAFIGKRSPIWFFKNFFPAQVVAFSTASSAATLPISMKTAQEKLKVPESISSFTQSLGATINMDGTAIMQGAAVIFIAQAYGIELTMAQLLTVVLTAVLASIGTAAVPGAGLIMLAMVLTSVGLPVEGIALVLGVDRLLDMVRTAVNITGDAACAVVVAKSEGVLGEPDVEEIQGETEIA